MSGEIGEKFFSHFISRKFICFILNLQPLDVQNLYCLWGKSETLLNNLSERFEMVLITDLFDYFREPWAYAIYHDKFNDLIEELNYLMTSTIVINRSGIVRKIT